MAELIQTCLLFCIKTGYAGTVFKYIKAEMLKLHPHSFFLEKHGGISMKLIYAIVRNDNQDTVTTALSKNGYSITKLSTTGGFLRKGNVTLMICTEDEKVDKAIELIRSECGERQKITVDMPFISGMNMINYSTMPMQIEVGGATIFVTNVERFEKF